MVPTPAQCDWCARRPSQSFEKLGDILVRYSRGSPNLRINKEFLCFEHIKVTAKYSFSIKYDEGNDRSH